MMKMNPLFLLSLLLLILTVAHSQSYLPLTYSIPSSNTECLYERITNAHEHVTSSIFLLSGQELTAAYTFEGPVAPIDIESNGRELHKYIEIYNQQGTKMFVNGRYGDSMMNVIPIQISGIVDMEEESEDYVDDTVEEMERLEEMERERERNTNNNNRFNRHHREEMEEEGRRYQEMREEMEELRRGHPDMDDYEIEHEEMLLRQMEEEAMMDDDFVKLQMDHEAHNRGGNGRRLQEQEEFSHKYNEGRRRLTDIEKLTPGEPFQKTVTAESPGWYRLCVTAKWGDIDAEIELRKSSTFGPVSPHDGHVPGSDASNTHSEIHQLYEKEDDATILAEEGAIKPEDLVASREQIRILERVYQEIIAKQLEERRVWNWRTTKNQHLYSHLVLGNLVETVVYCVISGYQVLTIRKWFGGGPSLGR